MYVGFSFYKVARVSQRFLRDNFATGHILLVLRNSLALHPCLIFMVKQEAEELEEAVEGWLI